jgi:hypothetical protein
MSSNRMNSPQTVTEINQSLAQIDNETAAALNSVAENLAQSVRVLKAAADFVTATTPDSGSSGLMPKIPEMYAVSVRSMIEHANALRSSLHQMRRMAEMVARLHEEAQAEARRRSTRSVMAGRRSI